MKIVYVSCHEVLEFYECRMFSEMGHEVFSLNGAYQNPGDDPGRKRPGISSMRTIPRMMELALQCSRENIHPEIIEWADVIIFMHMPGWVRSNWENIKHKRVIFRSIGQSTPGVEQSLIWPRTQGLQVVRYSPKESEIPLFIGSDAMIRFNMRPDEYSGWTGEDLTPITFTQSAQDRGTHCGYQFMERIHEQLPEFRLYGNGNENSPFAGGLVSSERQREILRQSRVYFTAGTHPASYTLNFMEAWMTGAPVVAVGPSWGNPRMSGYPQDTYEVHELIKNGETGFVADDPETAVSWMCLLLQDRGLADSVSTAGRAAAIEVFGEEKIAAQWQEFLGAN